MTSISWSPLEDAARLLECDEREVVLGDLVEANENSWRALFEVLGLVLRREAVLWKSWRPWLAGFGVALPSSFLLMGVSVSVSCTYQRLTWHKTFDACAPTAHEGFVLLLCHVLLLTAWAWANGFLVGSMSRRTLWASAALCALPCLFCLSRFRIESLPRFCLLLFLLPALWGVHQGLRFLRIHVATALLLAGSVTMLMICVWNSRALWIPNWVLVWPAWHLVVTARRATGGIASGRDLRTGT